MKVSEGSHVTSLGTTCESSQTKVGRLPKRSKENTVDMAGIKEELNARHQKIYELLAEGKNKEVLDYYTEDCVIMPPGTEAVQGKDAYLKLIEASAEFQSKVGKTESVELEVFGEGDMVSSRNKGTVYGKDGSVILQTKGLTVWKKVDGKYLVHNIVWNTDKPFSL